MHYTDRLNVGLEYQHADKIMENWSNFYLDHSQKLHRPIISPGGVVSGVSRTIS
jgi:hypothetical protein